jgi:DNA primase
MADLRDIRRIYSITDVLERAGFMVRRKWMVCPLPNHIHGRNTPSFSIFTGRDGVERFQCHGTCGAYGDVIDLAGYLWINGYDPTDPKMVMRAADALRNRNDIVFPVSETVVQNILDPAAWKKYLPIGPAARAYAHSRGLTDQTIETFALGQDGDYLTIPTFEAGRLTYIKKRAIKQGMLRFQSEPHSRRSLFNFDAVAWNPGIVYYVKAEIPAMILIQGGFTACAPTTGEASWDPTWATLLALANVVVIGDNDAPGKAAAKTVSERLNATLHFPPEEYKDIDEWILASPMNAGTSLVYWGGHA